MILKKGTILKFKDRKEKILHVKNCRISGNVITENRKYSTDFIMRWIEFGFIELIKNE